MLSNPQTGTSRDRDRDAGARVRDHGRRLRREQSPHHLDEADQPEGPEIAHGKAGPAG